MNIALFGREISGNDINKLSVILDRLNSKGVSLCYHKKLYDSIISSRNVNVPQGSLFSSASDLPLDTDILLSIGGDGTFLRSLTYLEGKNIPVAGINFGRLGFLTTARVGSGSNDWIEDLVNGRFSIEKRNILKITSSAVPENFYPYSLNEISIQRHGGAMLELDIFLNGKKLPTYWADGIVVATPTGSTAYSLSVGGPIVTPDSEVFILAPIAPHNLNIRPIVTPSDATIEIVFNTKNQKAVITADNRSFVAASGTKIVIRKGEYILNYVSLFDLNFIDALKDKLLWGEDMRNYITK